MLLSGDARSVQKLDLLPTGRLAAPVTAVFARILRPGAGPSIRSDSLCLPENPIWARQRLGAGRGEPKHCREWGTVGGERPDLQAHPAIGSYAAVPSGGLAWRETVSAGHAPGGGKGQLLA